MQDQVTKFSRSPVAAVLDCDGLLVDTAPYWHAAYRVALNRAGGSLDGFDLASLNGASVGLAAYRLSQVTGARVTLKALHDALEEAVDRGSIPVLPGVERLLTSLAVRMPLAVATNAPGAVARAALLKARLERFFSVLVSAEETRAPKPAPDVYLEACRRLNVAPADAVAFEDSALGVAAARAASMMVVGVPSLGTTLPDAHLTVARLDDPRVFALLGVDD